ncbi:MAG TPA: L,D-transpeptidase family protein [Acidimicrobiales bacterium]|nr:L,D-transpeptidase family protein [Acidimicrobiales bacterium]
MPLHVRQHSLITAAAAMSLVLTGCRSYDGPPEEAAAAATTTTAPPSTTTTTTTTTVAPTAAPGAAQTTATTAPLPGLGRGATGPEVQALEARLAALRYDVGAVDGNFDLATYHAVMAFQKATGMARTARATPDVVAALATAAMPTPQLADGGPDRVEIDLPRQILTLWQGGQLVRTLSVSTGTGKRYCVDGQCAKAVTPGGSFKITRKINGLRVSRLGQLYNPLYFNGGIAIHGSGSVPAGPASHGCVRIPMTASKWFYDTVPVGTPVYVLGGARAPVPFNEQAPGDETTTTTAATVPTTVVDSTTTAPPTTVLTIPTIETTTTTTTTTTLPPPPPLLP